MREKPNVTVVTFPIGESGFTPLQHLIRILNPLTGKMQLITGNSGCSFFKENRQIRTYEIRHKKGKNPMTRLLKYVLTQMKFIPIMTKMKDTDAFLFFFGGESLVIPILTAKLLGKNVVLTLPASSVEISRARKDVFSIFLRILEQTNCLLSDRIVITSERLVKEYSLQVHRKKILIAHEHFIDFDKFSAKTRLSERDDLVGFIGRLSEEKGILNFARAIPKILEIRETRFFIGGNGPQSEDVERYLEKEGLQGKVVAAGWVSHESIPNCLNRFKLLVIPSYTESGPLIAFEAMACGTIVLGSRVGMMPEVLRDGENGFLLADNSSEIIAKRVLEILSRADLNEISSSAIKTVQNSFTYQAAVESYRSVLQAL
jgi:glycosyltransferase involved in cell wall biosynthesis